MSPYQKAHKNALDVQDACNLVAVVKSFDRDLTVLRESPECTGTDWIRRHPVTIWYVDKLHDLTGRPNDAELSRAYSELIKTTNDS